MTMSRNTANRLYGRQNVMVQPGQLRGQEEQRQQGQCQEVELERNNFQKMIAV